MFLIKICFRDAVYHLACFKRLVSLKPSLQYEAMKWLQNYSWFGDYRTCQ